MGSRVRATEAAFRASWVIRAEYVSVSAGGREERIAEPKMTERGGAKRRV